MLCVCKACPESVPKLLLSDAFTGLEGAILSCKLYCTRFWTEWVKVI